jgi:adenylate kinase
MQVYRDDTAPLLDYYRDRLVRVDAFGEIDEVTARALDALRARR